MIFMATKPPSKPNLPVVQRPAQDDGGSVVLERRALKTKPPQMHRVLMLNDDFTPMEFVIVVLQEFFSKDRETATQIMLQGGPGAGRRKQVWASAAMCERAG